MCKDGDPPDEEDPWRVAMSRTDDDADWRDLTRAIYRAANEPHLVLLEHSARVAGLRIKRHDDGVLVVGSPAALEDASRVLQAAALAVRNPQHCAMLGAMSCAILAVLAGSARDGVPI